MNTTKKLQRIKEICQANLEIAAKRTPNKWGVWGMSVLAATENSFDVATMKAVCTTDYMDKDGRPRTFDANFIAICAGAAEAGWKATIAAIDYIGCDAEIFDANTPRGAAARSQLDAIISAWEDQL